MTSFTHVFIQSYTAFIFYFHIFSRLAVYRRMKFQVKYLLLIHSEMHSKVACSPIELELPGHIFSEPYRATAPRGNDNQQLDWPLYLKCFFYVIVEICFLAISFSFLNFLTRILMIIFTTIEFTLQVPGEYFLSFILIPLMY